ncbi:MAG: hypothetical protein A2511_05805 [Deltaproteobacteria bacterium RIFOXYD12_FULL_50_9]|nr:MAG: hypothetical protein A2511_05805 [Deltaproteobacteria bacterium RIFOXYD12_FULL_50_9]
MNTSTIFYGHIKPVSEEKFIHYAQLAFAAAELNIYLEKNIPKSDVKNEMRWWSKFFHFTNHPMNRILFAIKDNMPEDEQEELMLSMSMRIFALQDIIFRPELAAWVKYNKGFPRFVSVHPVIFKTAATAPLGFNLNFLVDVFRDLVTQNNQFVEKRGQIKEEASPKNFYDMLSET